VADDSCQWGRYVSAEEPCPICGSDQECRWRTDPALLCVYKDQQPEGHPCLGGDGAVYKAGKVFREGETARGQFWIWVADKQSIDSKTAPHFALESAAQAEKRVWVSRKARGIWTGAKEGEDHERLRAYLAARGIDVARLPGGRVPKVVRYHPKCVYWDHKAKAELFLPAMVAAVQPHQRAPSRSWRCDAVHRTYLDDEAPRKRDLEVSKQSLGGVAAGRAIRLRTDYPDGLLILAEGIETALACMAATNRAAWSTISTTGMRQIALPWELARPGAPDALRTIVIAADLDRSRGGQEAAYAARARLLDLYPHLEVRVRMPGAQDAPGLVGLAETGPVPAAGAKTVDWLDVLVASGADVVRERLLGTHALASASGGSGEGGRVGDDGLWWEDDGRAVISSDPVDRARLFLLEQCWEAAGWTRFGLLRAMDRWWVFEGPHYEQIAQELLENVVAAWLKRFHTMTSRGKVVPIVPTEGVVNEVRRKLSIEASVDCDEIPCFLPPTISEGEPRWLQGLKGRRKAVRGAAEPKRLISMANGLLSIDDLIAHRIDRLREHTPDVFLAGSLPFELKLDDLAEALAIDWCNPYDERSWALYQRLCPAWGTFQLGQAEHDPDVVRLNQEMFGDTISNDRSIEKLFFCTGPRRGGKGTTEEALYACCGEHNIAAIDFNMLTDRYWAAALVGKPVALMSDAKFGDFRDNATVVSRLNTISGGGRDGARVSVRDMYQIADSQRLNCRIWIFCNELPDLRDHSGAFAGRMIALPRPKSVYGDEDPRVKASIAGEGAGIMIWALVGLARVFRQDRPHIEPTVAGRHIAVDYMRSSAHLEAFLEDCCERSPDAEVAKSTLLETYKAYCEQEDHKNPLGQNKFKQSLRMLVPGFGEVQRGGTGERVWHYRGVRLADGVAFERTWDERRGETTRLAYPERAGAGDDPPF
jgi:P4 family phage/plasmid primase-like protien